MTPTLPDTGDLNVPVVRGFLVRRYGESVVNVTALSGGDWSKAFAFTMEGGNYVVRFGQHEDDYRMDELAMSFASADLVVPRVLEVGVAPNGAYAVSERHDGVFLETLDDAGWQAVMPALLRTLDSLRNVELPAGTRCLPTRATATATATANSDHAPAIPEPTTWHQLLEHSLIDFPGGRVSGWRAAIKANREYEVIFERGERELQSLLTYVPEIRHVLHQDFLNRNVLVSEDHTRIEAVFDWGCLAYGDFLYEVAWFTFWSAWFPALASADFLSALRSHYDDLAVPVPNFDQRLRCYEIHIALVAMAYVAFRGRRNELRALVTRLGEVLDS